MTVIWNSSSCPLIKESFFMENLSGNFNSICTDYKSIFKGRKKRKLVLFLYNNKNNHNSINVYMLVSLEVEERNLQQAMDQFPEIPLEML